MIQDGQINPNVKSVELIVDLESLKPGGLCAIGVIVDPQWRGSLARLNIVTDPSSRYFGTFQYDAHGINVIKNVKGAIPSPR